MPEQLDFTAGRLETHESSEHVCVFIFSRCHPGVRSRQGLIQYVAVVFEPQLLLAKPGMFGHVLFDSVMVGSHVVTDCCGFRLVMLVDLQFLSQKIHEDLSYC